MFACEVFSNAANPVTTVYSTPSWSKIMLGELGGEAEDSKNSIAKQQDVSSTRDRKSRKHPITLAHIKESPEKCEPICCKIILMVLIKTYCFCFINCSSHSGKLSALDNVREMCFLIQMIKLGIALKANTAGMLQYRRNKKNSLTTSVTTSKAA